VGCGRVKGGFGGVELRINDFELGKSQTEMVKSARCKEW
jgi:hypothetical protein